MLHQSYAGSAIARAERTGDRVKDVEKVRNYVRSIDRVGNFAEGPYRYSTIVDMPKETERLEARVTLAAVVAGPGMAASGFRLQNSAL